MIRHKKAEILRNGKKCIFVMSYALPKEEDILSFIKNYQSEDCSTIVLIRKDDGTYKLHGIKSEDFEEFCSNGKFEKLQWEEGIE